MSPDTTVVPDSSIAIHYLRGLLLVDQHLFASVKSEFELIVKKNPNPATATTSTGFFLSQAPTEFIRHPGKGAHLFVRRLVAMRVLMIRDLMVIVNYSKIVFRGPGNVDLRIGVICFRLRMGTSILRPRRSLNAIVLCPTDTSTSSPARWVIVSSPSDGT